VKFLRGFAVKHGAMFVVVHGHPRGRRMGI